MQTVKSELQLCHPLLCEIDALYADLSEVAEQKKLFPVTYDKSIKGIVDIFEYESDVLRNFTYTDEDIKPIDVPDNGRNIIVCFSGGKDSFAVARYYQKRKYNVYLYHLKGLNATYCGEYSEHFIAQKASEYLGLPLIIEEVSYAGYHEWVEHPMKNMVMATRALSWGIRNGVTTRIAVGTFKTAFISDNVFAVCAGDCVEMWKAYDKVIRRIIPRYRTLYPNENYQTAYDIIKDEPQALEVLVSCMTPNRFRRAFRERTISRYGIDLLPNRCGCCWKDCVEYVWFADRGILPLNKRYYVHCLEVINNTYNKETGVRFYSVRALWNYYFFYPITQSIMYKEINNAVIQAHGKIAYSDNLVEG